MSFQNKRQMNYRLEPVQQDINPDIAALSTIGMRIRKAVADGYSTPSASHYSYGYNFEEQPRRVPLPMGMDQPPSLMGSGSTVGTCSNLSEWDNAAQKPLVTIPDYNSGMTKRKFQQESGDAEYTRYREEVDYAKKYGNLLFNEEF